MSRLPLSFRAAKRLAAARIDKSSGRVFDSVGWIRAFFPRRKR